MSSARRSLLLKPLVILAVMSALILAGCMGPRGWPGATQAGGALIVGTMDGRLLALNPESGTRSWKWEATQEQTPSLFSCGGGAGQFRAGSIYGSPTAGNATVYIGTYAGIVYAIRADGGQDVWEYEAGSPIAGGAALAGETLFVGSADGKLHAIDANKGEARPGFSFKAKDKIWATPVVVDGTVYFGSLDHNLYAVDVETGESRWAQPFDTGGGIGSAPLFLDGVLYVGSFNGKLYAVEADTGTQKWVFEGASDWFWGDAVHKDGVIYACSLDEHVYAVSAASGEPVWSSPFDAGGRIKSSPVIVEDVLVVATENGTVYGIDLAAGTEAWPPFDVEATVLAPLYSSGSKVFLSAQDNRLYTFDGTTGTQGWSVKLAD